MSSNLFYEKLAVFLWFYALNLAPLEGPLVAKTSSTKAPLTHQSSSGHSPNAPNATVSRNTSPLAAIAHRPSLIAASVASSTGPPIFYKLEEILNRHAESLLEDYAIRDLGKQGNCDIVSHR